MISEGLRRAGPYATNGAQTEFAFDFKMLAGSEASVVVTITEDNDDTNLVYEDDYTVTLNEDQDTEPGGTIETLEAWDDVQLSISSNDPIEQPAVFTNSGGFFPRVLNDCLDRLTIYAQQLWEMVIRAPLLPRGDPPLGQFPVVMPDGEWGFSAGTGTDDGLRIDLSTYDGSEFVGHKGGTVRSFLDELEGEFGAELIGHGEGNTVADTLDALDADIVVEGVTRAAGDAALDTRVDALEATYTSGIRAYLTWADLEAKFQAYNAGTAYAVDDGAYDQAAFWINIQAGTGNAPPTLPTVSNAFWRLLDQTPGGSVAQVSATDTGTHTDPVVGGTVDNAGVFRWSGVEEAWERIDDLDSQVAEGHKDAAEAAAEVLGGDAALGAIPASEGTAGDLTWYRRDLLSNQPVTDVDTTGIAGVQFFNQVGTPDIRATLGTADGNFTITAGASIGSNIPSCLIGHPKQFEIGATYVVEGATTVLPSVQTGLIFGFLNGAPTPGGATALTPAGTALLVMRGNGTINVYDTAGALYPGAVFAYPDGAPSPGSLSRTFTTETCRLIVTMLSATSAIVVPVIDGVPEGARLLTGLPASCYFAAGLRIFGATCAGTISLMSTRGASLDVPLCLFIDPDAAAPGGAGTEDDPFKTLAELQAKIDTDALRRSLVVRAKGGTLRGTLSIDGNKWRDIDIACHAGGDLIIKPATLVTSGWTLVPGSTGGAVYKRIATDVPFAGNRSYGGYVEVGDDVVQSDIYGPDGFHHEITGFALYDRLPADTLPTDEDFVPGSYTRHISGADDGYDFIRCYDDGDPNDKEFERSIAGYGINIIPSNVNGWTGTKVRIHNLSVHYAFLAGIQANACDVDIQGVYVRGAQVGYAFELDGTSGRLAGFLIEGCGFDGIHAAGNLGFSDREARLIIEDGMILGIAFLPQGFGDGMSAHLWDRHWWSVSRVIIKGVGKDGAAMSGRSEFYSVTVIGARGAGITAYSQAELLVQSVVEVHDSIFQGCTYGLNANTATFANSHRTINAWNTLLLDCETPLLAYTDGAGTPTATINAVRCEADECGPIGTAGGGVINLRLSPTLELV